jgi:uncharacterized protein (TIGR00297 family)
VLDRQLNIFFFFATIFVFLLFSEGEDHIRFLSAIGLSIIFVLAGYLLNWLTLDGAASAVLFGVISLGLGGLIGATVVLGFFITSSLLSKNQEDEDGFATIHFRRNGMQVWSNGFWFAFWTLFWFTTDSMVFLIAAISAMSFSTADTWGSEVGGNRVKGTTWLFGPFRRVEPGIDGGVSILGTLATLAGACVIGAIYWLFYQDLPVGYLIIIVCAGLLGSFVDSLFGTYIQGNKLHEKVSLLFNHKINTFDNNLTNWASSGVASILAIGIFFLIS